MIGASKLNNLDFAAFTKKEFGIDAVEYWNRPFFTKAKDKAYMADMKKRAADAGVQNLLITIDGEGKMGDPNEKKRLEAVEKHYKWVEAAKSLDCHSIRVNAVSQSTFEEQMKLAADGLGKPSEFAAELGLNVIAENHGGLFSDGTWLAGVMKMIDLKNCGKPDEVAGIKLTQKLLERVREELAA